MPRTEQWARLKRAAWDRSRGSCERCGKPTRLGNGLSHLHHLTYARKGHELLEDVQLLCLDCHGQSHPRHEFLALSVQRCRASARRKAPKPRDGRWEAENGRLREELRRTVASRKAARKSKRRFRPHGEKYG